jgi:hypothetical protein
MSARVLPRESGRIEEEKAAEGREGEGVYLPQPDIAQSPKLGVSGTPLGSKHPDADGRYAPASYDSVRANGFLCHACRRGGRQLWTFQPEGTPRIYAISFMDAARVPEYLADKPSGWELSVTELDEKDDGAFDEESGLGSTVAFAPSQAGEQPGPGLPPTSGWREMPAEDAASFQDLRVVVAG